MKIINDFNYFNKGKNIGKAGYNADVVKYEGDAIKIFNKWDRQRLWKMEAKERKLKILQELNLEEYVKIKELYGYIKEEKEILWAYSMQYLDKNILTRRIMNKLSIDEKREILLKVLDTLKVGHQYDIYNYDLKSSNFHLSKEGKLTAFDVDNFRIDTLEVEETNCKYYDIRNKVDEATPLQIENYTFLCLCLEFYYKEYSHSIPIGKVGEIIYTLALDEKVKDIFYAILDGEENVDLKELVTSVSSNQPYLKKRLFHNF